ncbi:hypothetical protein G3N59_27305 [Paraburkholderia sp. Ac-20340]|uniref:hypothetical protein n=1 Tax=Paraburkholderia sp. Ac-20340 TaxID=2703888 RepID=UPI0019802084|nr:hypothetical protein [Paraburkholderia sp. Ac-20340]MBN3857095.1 hypothetical protein [Paraburkholderia sp. Ac-20340]
MDAERLAFARLSQETYIDSNRHVMEKLATVAIPSIGPAPFNRLSAKRMTVVFPGSQSQISAYKITQYKEINAFGVGQSLNVPGRVELQGGAVILTFNTQTQIGGTAITYWSNVFSDQDVNFELPRSQS